MREKRDSQPGPDCGVYADEVGCSNGDGLADAVVPESFQGAGPQAALVVEQH